MKIKKLKINIKVFFPNVRESKIEYAIISLASKQIVDIGYDKKEKQIHLLKTTYYQIQKEIVDAINLREGKNLSPNECPYNTTSIKEALEVLRKTTITVKDEKGEKQYIFSRIKDMYMDGDATKDDYANALRSYQAYLDEIKSDQRDKAAAAKDIYKYYETIF